jgi:beta-galactosidase
MIAASLAFAFASLGLTIGSSVDAAERQRLNIDGGWRFAYGNANNPSLDFGYGTRAFFFAKAGYGDGPAASNYNDGGWRKVDLPHDWAVELPFDAKGNTNHGSKAIGLEFPDNSVGWYRKSLAIPAEAKGKRVSLVFDGVYRDSVLWVNGHYIGTEPSGYTSFQYDITDYLNYGGDNVIALRVDATREEGWFYEGAGIYRHVWLTTTEDLHVAPWGTFVDAKPQGDQADVAIETTVVNDSREEKTFSVDVDLLDPAGKLVATSHGEPMTIPARQTVVAKQNVFVAKPQLWSLATPQLYKAVARIRANGTDADQVETPFGIRTIIWDAEKGLLLNGEHVELHGVDIHQDFAGVGVAVPDSVQTYRLKQLKSIGVNALRMSHNPPNPEVLDAADRMGLLVIDEHRMMGTTPEIRGQLEAMVRRDRNHPSVAIWSVGNEEWALEWSPLGTHLADEMQYIVQKLDPSRRTTVATSGSSEGVSLAADVIGFNYHTQHNIDAFHNTHLGTPAVMTEEGATTATRGIYVDDMPGVHLAAYDREPRPGHSASVEEAWKFTAARPFLAGMFVWTGFDYRGETTPFGWPAISSQFGMLDTGGIVKDSGYYLKSVWTQTPMVHILPHWNWPGKAGQPIDVWVYSNASEVELLLNGKSLGRKTLEKYGHLEWSVPYAPGKLEARGFERGKLVTREVVETSGAAKSVAVQADRSTLQSGGSDTTVVTLRVVDAKNRLVPDASNTLSFATTGPVRIIGVGNGDPASHEADKPTERFAFIKIANWRSLAVDGTAGRTETAADQSTADWRDPFQWLPPEKQPATTPAVVLRGEFDAPDVKPGQTLQWLVGEIGKNQTVYLNGVAVAPEEVDGARIVRIDAASLKPHNTVAYVFDTPEGGVAKMADNSVGGTSWGQLRVVTPAQDWTRRSFGGYAVVVLQATDDSGQGHLTVTGDGLKAATADFTVR